MPDAGIVIRRATLAMAPLLSSCHAAVPRAGSASIPAARVIFVDDFSAPQIDRAKWTVEVRGRTDNDEQQAYVDSAATMHIAHGREAEGATDGAALVITPRYRPGFVAPDGARRDFLSTRLHTRQKFEFAYGTAAARMKLSSGPGLWPAFWLLGTGDWPATGEIDVMENTGQRAWTSVALHGPGYSGDTPLVSRHTFPSADDVTGWHVYSVDWFPDSLIFRVDRDVVYRVNRPMVERYGRWAFDNPKFLILNLALGGGYPMATNGARTPYAGLPESTVELIRQDGGRVLVDWVRVTAPARVP